VVQHHIVVAVVLFLALLLLLLEEEERVVEGLAVHQHDTSCTAEAGRAGES